MAHALTQLTQLLTYDNRQKPDFSFEKSGFFFLFYDWASLFSFKTLVIDYAIPLIY